MVFVFISEDNIEVEEAMNEEHLLNVESKFDIDLIILFLPLSDIFYIPTVLIRPLLKLYSR